MSTEITVMKLISAIEARNIELISDLLSSDIVFENVPEQTVIAEKQEVIRRFKDFFNLTTSIKWNIKNKVIVEKIAIIERMAHIVISGCDIYMPMITVMEVCDDKITLFRDYFDSASFSKQLESKGVCNE